MIDNAKELLAPMTSPVREALETTRRALIALRTRLKTEPAVQGRGWVDLGIVLNNAVDEADRALSAAPGEPCAGKPQRGVHGGDNPSEWHARIFRASERANHRFGQWMPQRWIEMFIEEMNRLDEMVDR